MAPTSRQVIEEKIQEFIANDLLHGEAEDLTPRTNLLALGIIDSLSMELLDTFIEKNFGVELPDSVQPEDLSTIAAVALVVERLQRDAAAKK